MQTIDTGMSLRDWFAGQALPALIAKLTVEDVISVAPDEIRNRTAIASFMIADAMISARKEKP